MGELTDLIPTPSYVFDEDAFQNRIRRISEYLTDIPLCYSIKANPFLVGSIPKEISHLEVCSPGELTICEKMDVDLSTVVFSGVNKTAENVEQAMKDNVGVFTAESSLHLMLINECAAKHSKKVKLILRLSCGNQFGMDEEELKEIIAHRGKYKNTEIVGIHYYTGTQKKKAALILKELEKLDSLLTQLKCDYNYNASMVEYGPGMACDYFGESPEETDMQLLSEIADGLKDFAGKYPLSVEMGRFMASDCGYYYTKVDDTKVIHGINYAICDGGVHHLKYYGQTMSMQVPPIRVLNPFDGETKPWSLCGSLCTTADVFVRKVELTGLGQGSVIEFGRCGAYSVTEAPVLFLSRPFPEIYLISSEKGLRKVRETVLACDLNLAKTE